jgi:hypothetical protein
MCSSKHANPVVISKHKRLCDRGLKTRYFEKFEINISTCRIQTKLSTSKRLNTRNISLLLTWAIAEEFRRYSIFSRYELQNVWPSGE